MNDNNFLESLASCFELLPGVGKKTANRYAYSVVEKLTDEQVEYFANVLKNTKSKVTHCKCCGMLTDQSICNYCQDDSRDHNKILVVRDTKDVLSMEKTKAYNGMYHCLNGLISPIDGIGPDDIDIDKLLSRISDNITEIILATPFTPSGETTALYLANILRNKNISVSRLGYGLPAGGDLEFIDELTLKKSLESRIKQ